MFQGFQLVKTVILAVVGHGNVTVFLVISGPVTIPSHIVLLVTPKIVIASSGWTLSFILESLPGVSRHVCSVSSGVVSSYNSYCLMMLSKLLRSSLMWPLERCI